MDSRLMKSIKLSLLATAALASLAITMTMQQQSVAAFNDQNQLAGYAQTIQLVIPVVVLVILEEHSIVNKGILTLTATHKELQMNVESIPTTGATRPN